MKQTNKKKKDKLCFFLGRLLRGHTGPSYRCYVNVPSFQTMLLKSQVTTPSTVSVESLALHRCPFQCWNTPCCNHSLPWGSGSFAWVGCCANLCPQLASTPEKLLAAMSLLVPDVGCRVSSREGLLLPSALVSCVWHLLGWNVLTSMGACHRAHCK